MRWISASIRHHLAVPILVLILGWTITALVTWNRLDDLKRNRQIRFDNLVERVDREVRRRLESPTVALLGFEGMLANQDTIDRKSFERYVQAMDMPRQFPGIRGVGYVEAVRRENLGSWVEQIRSTEDSGFRIHPVGAHPYAFVIRLVEPRTRNAKAVGFDMSSDPTRREAVEAASRTDEIQLCGRISLFQDDRPRPAMLEMHSIPRLAGTTPTGVESIRGIVYAAFIFEELLSGIQTTTQDMIDLQMFDSSDTDTAQALYKLDVSKKYLTTGNALHHRQILSVAGRKIIVRFSALPRFEQEYPLDGAWLRGLLGGLVSLLLSALASSMTTGRRRIEALVETRTSELEATQTKLVAALRRSQAMVDAVTRHALVNFTTPAGVILEVNEAFCSLVGWSREELLGKTHRIMNSGVHPKAFWTQMRGEIDRGNAWRGEVCNRTRDGKLVWMDTLIVPFIDDPTGKVEKHLAIRFDITHRKQAELDLVQAKKQAEAANESKSAFLANMSHEIRTPMNGVLGMISVLLNTTLSENQRRYAQLVRSSAESLLVILNDILDFSKIEAGKLELESIHFDLGELVENVCAVLSFKANEKGIRISSRLADSTPRAYLGDPGRLRQILLNLGGNALKFTNEGHVEIQVESVSTDAEQSTLRFTVSDTGIGIPAEKLHDLFQPFIQADASTTRKYGGTGLGLAICRQLVEIMGGKIGVESKLDKGSVFWFEIVLPRDGAGDSTHPGQMIEETSISQRFEGRVLVAEDNLINQIVAKAILQQLGLEVCLASNGEEALHRLHEERFDLVLMDMQMPVLDGLDATMRWREQDAGATPRDVPIVALTANAMKEDRDSCLAAGMVDFLSKPFSETDFREIFWRWLPRR